MIPVKHPRRPRRKSPGHGAPLPPSREDLYRQMAGMSRHIQKAMTRPGFLRYQRYVSILDSISSLWNRMLLRPLKPGQESLWVLLGKVFRYMRHEGIPATVARFFNPSHPLHHYPVGRYQAWIRLHENFLPEPTGKTGRIRVSVLMPTYNSQKEWLTQAIESVRSQTYREWELCIVDDASTSPETLATLAHWARMDSRIRVFYRKENGHISASTNDAIRIARGEWLAFLDHDDVLAPHALATMVAAVENRPEIQVAYSDEDKIGEDGVRTQPFFKPDFDPELFLGINMVCHLGFYRKSLVESVGGFRINYEGAQDYDLTIRCFEKIGTGGFLHVPRVLYHWRIHPGSTAGDETDAKPYAKDAQYRSLRDYFRRQNIPVHIRAKPTGFHLAYTLPGTPPKVSVILPVLGDGSCLDHCFPTLVQETTYPNYEVILVHGRHQQNILDRVLKRILPGIPVTRIRVNDGVELAGRIQAGIDRARGEILAILHTHLEVLTPMWLDEMVSHATRPGVGAVGAKILYPDDTLHHVGITLGMGGIAGYPFQRLPRKALGYFGRAQLVCCYSAVSGKCLLVQKKIADRVGGYHQKQVPSDWQDVDFCLRIGKAGYRNLFTPWAEFRRHTAPPGIPGPMTQTSPADMAAMKHRWGALLQNDPFYNLNLSLDDEPFTLAWPPRHFQGLLEPAEERENTGDLRR